MMLLLSVSTDQVLITLDLFPVFASGLEYIKQLASYENFDWS